MLTAQPNVASITPAELHTTVARDDTGCCVEVTMAWPRRCPASPPMLMTCWVSPEARHDRGVLGGRRTGLSFSWYPWCGSVMACLARIRSQRRGSGEACFASGLRLPAGELSSGRPNQEIHYRRHWYRSPHARRCPACSRAKDTSTCIACRSGFAESSSCIQTVDPWPSESTALSSAIGA